MPTNLADGIREHQLDQPHNRTKVNYSYIIPKSRKEVFWTTNQNVKGVSHRTGFCEKRPYQKN